jgi:hypothetical protein
MAKKAAVLLTLTLTALLAYAQGQVGGLIEGDTWAYLVSAPEGWVWDGTTLRVQGIRGLFYKAGQAYSPSKLHIYISPTPKKAGGPVGLAQFIVADEASFMRADTGIIVKDLPPYEPGPGYRFELRDFDDRNEDYYQALAYYEGDAAFFIFVLSCRSVEEREAERASFLALLDTFTYIKKEGP